MTRCALQYRQRPTTCPGTWTLGHLDTWTIGHLDTWSLGHLVRGHLDTWIRLDTWTLGHLDTFDSLLYFPKPVGASAGIAPKPIRSSRFPLLPLASRPQSASAGIAKRNQFVLHRCRRGTPMLVSGQKSLQNRPQMGTAWTGERDGDDEIDDEYASGEGWS